MRKRKYTLTYRGEQMSDKLTITERNLQEMNGNGPKTPDDQFTAWKKKKAKEMFEKMVIRINSKVNLREFKEKYFPNEDRTLEFIIDGMEDVDTGFVFQDGKVRTIQKLRDTPTVTFQCDEDTFLRLATQEITFPQAYFYGWLKVTGKNYLRDYEIFKEMFRRYGHILKGE